MKLEMVPIQGKVLEKAREFYGITATEIAQAQLQAQQQAQYMQMNGYYNYNNLYDQGSTNWGTGSEI